MKYRISALSLFMAFCIVLAFAALPQTEAAPTVATSNLPLLEVIGAANVDSEPDSMIIRCEGYRCRRYHELVYWSLDKKIYFLDAHSLSATGVPLLTTLSDFSGSRYLFYDRYWRQIYALDRMSVGSFPDTWYQAVVRLIRRYDYIEGIPINDDENTPIPVDKYYYIDGAALLLPYTQSGQVNLYVDNPVNGNVDVVSFHGQTPETSQSRRLSYRVPLGCATTNTCTWNKNSGNSLAIAQFGDIYVADNNDLIDQIVVLSSLGVPKPPFANVGSLFPCYVDEAGITMASDENVLYLPAGCQSFADGAVARLDTTGNFTHQVTYLPYIDQNFVTVDWHDQKRAFIATADFSGRYDPSKQLFIHLLYDGQLIASLPLMSDYQWGSLGAMAFDPHTNKLYLAVDKTIYVVKVNYGGTAGFPPLPEGEGIVTPGATHDLLARDSSAVFHFSAGAVAENTRVTYKELPPTAVPSTTLPLVKTSNGTDLYAVRQFELTAVISSTGTVVNSFNNDYQLKLYYSPNEGGPVIGGNGNMQLYRWDGSSWQQVGATFGSLNENLLFIYSNLTGRFAILGPTHPFYLPTILR